MYQYTPESIYGLCLPVVKPDPEPGYDANGSPVSWLCPCRSSMDRCLSMSCDDQLSPDLIEAARDAQGG